MDKNSFNKGEDDYDDPNDFVSTSVYKLYKWMVSECESEEDKHKTLTTYFLLKTIDNGDCLFHSIHLFLLSVLHRGTYTTFELRHAVAKTVLDLGNKEALHAMEMWKLILQSAIENGDKELQREYRHAFPLLKDVTPFEMVTRTKLFQNMLNVSIYWGDQYAIQVLESKLNVQFLVLKKTIVANAETIRGQVGVDHSGNLQWAPNWFGIFVLDGNHYMPLVRKRNFYKHSGNSSSSSIIHSKDEQDSYVACFRKRGIPKFVHKAYKRDRQKP